MAAQGRNSPFTNVRRFGREHSRPYISTPMLLACRICDKIFLNAHSLIEHYESHDGELAHQRTNFMPYQRERNNPFNHQIAPSSVYHQRPHPYFPNGYPTDSSFPVPTQNPQPFQPRNHPITSDGNLAASSSFPVSIRGRDSAASTGQFVVNQPTEIRRPQLGLSMNRMYQKTAPFLRIEDQKGYDESADKRTIWYLGQLEQPIPKIIDLESHEKIKLSLKC